MRRKNRDINVELWFRSISPVDAFLSAITIGEIENGIVRQERVNSGFADELKIWLDTLLLQYSDRILPFSTPVARRWGRLCGELGREDADMMISATALENNLIVATRNVKHFEPTGVQVLNPYEKSKRL